MRQRPVKNLDLIIEECAQWKAAHMTSMKGQWKNAFANPDGKVYLELGSGKGQFITKLAALHPENNYIACEAQENVGVRILQKTRELKLSNVLVILEKMENVEDSFEFGELDGLYLNFSDPWPKSGHEKRRLTYGKKLMQYKNVLKSGGFIEFKTDNDALFEYSLTQFDECGFEYEYTRDLYNSEFAEGNVSTEYEDKFASQGKTINFARLEIGN